MGHFQGPTFSDSGSSRDSKDDNIVEGAIAHGVGDRATTLLEGDVADTGTNPSRGHQYIRWTTPMNVVRRSLVHGAPSTRMDKRRRLVHAIESGDAGGLSMLAGPASPPPQPPTSVEAQTMAMVIPIAVRGSPLRPHSLADAFMAVHYKGAPWWCPPILAGYNKLISCCTGRIDQLTVGR